MKNKIKNIFSKREKVYYLLLFLTFGIVVISQIFMRFGAMEYFSAIETFEGDYITDEEMFNKSEIILEIKGELPQKIPEIYTNGERVGFLNEKKKKLIIETDSVIEIFCEEEPVNLSVNVKEDKKKVINYIKPYPVTLKVGFTPVARLSFV